MPVSACFLGEEFRESYSDKLVIRQSAKFHVCELAIMRLLQIKLVLPNEHDDRSLDYS